MNHNLFKLPRYKSIHHVRGTGKGGGIAVFLHESLTFNVRLNLLIKSKKKFLLTLRIVNQQEISINLRLFEHISC